MAKINTIVDGYDVKQVNILDEYDVEKRKNIVGFCLNGEKCDVVDIKGDYVRVQTVGYEVDDLGNRNSIRIDGWCRNEFVIGYHKVH